jgi:predicted nucleic acid-binding protein
MKLLITFLLLICSFSYSQLNKTKSYIDSNLEALSLDSKTTNGYLTENKILKKTLDTLKIVYNTGNIAVEIAVLNSKDGITSDSFHKLSYQLNSGFKLTHSSKNNENEFFYDSKLKRLIIKRYDSISYKKLIEIIFISDFEIIKSKFPQVINL